MKVNGEELGHYAYSLEYLKDSFKEIHAIDGGLVCVMDNSIADRDSIMVDFAVLRFHSSNIDGSGGMYACFWYGVGFSGSIRECRHSYFGEPASYWEEDQKPIDGYVSYLNGDLVKAACDVLKSYFDMD